MFLLNRNQKSERDSYIPQSCRIADSEELSAYADGMLEGRALRTISAHASHCPECTEALRDLGRVKSALRSVQNAPAPAAEGYWPKLYRSVRQEPRVDRVPVTTPAYFSSRAKATFGAAAICAGAMLLVAAPINIYYGSTHSHRTLADRTITAVSAPVSHLPRAAAADLSINALVESHARMVSDQPSEDHARAAFIVSDLSARASGEAAPAPVLQETSLQALPGTDGRSVVTSN